MEVGRSQSRARSIEALRQSMAETKCSFEQRCGGGVEQLIEALAAGVEAAVATVLQKHAREVEDVLDQLPVAILRHVQGV
jgi:DNA-binding GntR family transcriptional regulator